jgi:uncharacterized LabA/DUF88 family protein
MPLDRRLKMPDYPCQSAPPVGRPSNTRSLERGCGILFEPFNPQAKFMKKTALLIDGGWFGKGLASILKLPNDWPTPEQVLRNAQAVVGKDEEVFRIFYYDCPPFNGTLKNPIDGRQTNYASMRTYRARQQFIQDMGQNDLVALRLGELKTRGWLFAESYKSAVFTTPRATPKPITAAEVYPDFEQKGVDMRIGIDVSSLAHKRVVERIILFSGDTDMIPAMKLARREGLQIYVVRLNPWALSKRLIEDADGVRDHTPVA